MTNIESFHSILVLESKNNYNNKTVIGGLDGYLIQKALPIRESLSNQKIIAEFDQLNLTNINYAACNFQNRKIWICNALTWVDNVYKSQKKDSSDTKAPIKERVTISIIKNNNFLH